MPPAESENQQQAAGIALSAKRKGKCDSLPEGSASRQMCESMSIEELEKFAGTKTKNLPKKKKPKTDYKHAEYFS
jgi:hypothetical protein